MTDNIASIYTDSDVRSGPIHPTKESADAKVSLGRVACIKIEWEE